VPDLKADTVMHGRLLNWARCVSGAGLPRVAQVDILDPGWTVDELDAAVLESGLVRMRAERRRDYSVLRMFYLKRYSVVTMCYELRCSERQFYRMLDVCYGCLGNILRRECA
jgi:hypothetical protein